MKDGFETGEVLDFGERQGIRTRVHILDGEIVKETSFDAEPILDYAAALRLANEGKRYGNLTHVGVIPAAIQGYWMRYGMATDPKVIMKFLKDNPAFCTNPKAIK